MVLVTMLVVTSILMGMLQNTLRVRRQLHTERNARQTELLLQAAADRARFQLAKDSGYRGETWNVPSAELADRGDAEIAIKLNSTTEPSRGWQVTIAAEYPRGSPSSVRRTANLFIPQSNLLP